MGGGLPPAINIGARLRIGMIIPSVVFTSEPQIQAMLPDDVQLHSTRIRFHGSSEAQLRQMVSNLDECAELIASALPQRILFHCTAATTLTADAGKTISNRITELTGIPATSTGDALIAALKHLNAKKVVLITPYHQHVNDHEVEYLGHFGIDVVSEIGLGLPGSEFPKIDPADWFKLALSRKTDEADAYFISCAGARTTEVLEDLERDLGRPVVTSNNVVAWRCLRESGIQDRIEGFGALMRM